MTTVSEPCGTTHEIDATDPNHEDLLQREWLITNGTGTYAAGTAAGCNTRRYHGLLVAASKPPVGRLLALNQVMERLTLPPTDAGDPGNGLEFTTCLFRAGNSAGRVFAPHGARMMSRFERGLSVRWEYAWGPIVFSRELFLHWKQPAATLRYRISGPAGGATLRLQPMLTLRDFHGLMYRDGNPRFDTRSEGEDLFVRLGDTAVAMRCPDARFTPGEDWWYGLHYPVDAERGQGDHEDHYVPGAFEVDLPHDGDVLLSVALGPDAVEPRPDTDGRAAHLDPILRHVEATGGATGERSRTVTIAGDDFVVDRVIQGQELSTILAGYPWFADWGRDSFIALPGLLLCTGRFEQARAVLAAFARAIDGGLVPNRFDDYDDAAAHYNTVDASLWYIQAALQYFQMSGDGESWNGWLSDACVQVADAYIRGTRYDIAMAGDCLITSGSPQTQLTWMDARCGGEVFTPRHGKAVEINALWYAALAGLVDLLPEARRDKINHYQKLTGRVKRAFAGIFWREDGLGLYDHVWMDDAGERHSDASVRPNQIFVAALPHSPLPRTKLVQIVDVVREHLLTPRGLRTLPEDDPAYHHAYSGDQYHRDRAYHQGTIWPWLIGPYAEAVLRTGRFSDDARAEAHAAIAPLLNLMDGEGLGQLHEIHEAIEPHRPVGCFAQAWSVAEVIRVLWLIENGS